MDNNHFMGLNGFIWWVGVVENRIDPLKTGRTQVRIFGWNSPNKSLQPTEQLLWAHPMLPLNSNDVSPPKEGTVVVGFFLDGDGGQQPVMIGQTPGIPTQAANPNASFNDPRTGEQLQNAPRSPESITYNDDGSGAQITEAQQASNYPLYINEPTTSRIARNENIDSTIIKTKMDNTLTDLSTTGNGTWDEPKTSYNAKYPYNHVIETESGHVIELDDTPGSERIHIYHRSGTFEEIGPSGTKVDKVVKDRYDLTLGQSNEYVAGNKKETIKGSLNLLISTDYNITINGDVNQIINGNLNQTVNGQTNVTYNQPATYSFPLLTLKGPVVIEGDVEVIGNGDAGGIGNLHVTGLVKGDQDVQTQNISLLDHPHSGVQRGGSTTDPPVGTV